MQYLTDGKGAHRSKIPEKFEIVDVALTCAGISDKQKLEIYKILAAILHLGNVFLEENISTGKCQISELTKIHFESAAHLLNIEQRLLETALLTHTIEPKSFDKIM